MLETYPAKYSDEFGVEITTIENDGKLLRMILRGVEFESSMLDDWEAVTKIPTAAFFSLHRSELCACELDLEMPVQIFQNNDTLLGKLRVQLELGKPSANGGLDKEELQLELTSADRSFKSCGKHGWFEDELLEIHQLLPPATYLKSCFNCAFSDYSPAGFGLFGCMACIRNTKQEYRLPPVGFSPTITSKADYFQLQDRMTEQVQETYLCPEFEQRLSNTGYRG